MWSLSQELGDELCEGEGGVSMARLLLAVQTAVKTISCMARRGVEGPGALLHLANQVWLDQLVRSGAACLLISSEAASVIEVDPQAQGQFVVAFSPLDGADHKDMDQWTGGKYGGQL